MVWTLFFFVVAGVIAVFVWDYRRKAARRNIASRERFDQAFGTKSAPPAETAQSGVRAVTPVPAPPPVAAAAQTFLARERFLSQPGTLIYRLLKAGLPDHEIFSNVPLASLLDVPGKGYEREQQVRRLLQYQMDFVVCDKSMRIVAAVELEQAAGAGPGGERRFKEECFQASGIRLVRINPAGAPRHDEMRDLVLGGSPKPLT
jgi:hypothetical protein